MSKVKKNAAVIIMLVVMAAAVMSVIDGVIMPGYLVKSLVKIVMFSLIPIAYFAAQKRSLQELTLWLKPSKRSLVSAAVMAAGLYIVILGGYFALRGVIDFNKVTSSITGTAGVTASNFVFVAIYISLVNSFLEEFFFRGFAFLTLKKHCPRAMAYCISASLFALYHIGMTAGMGNAFLTLLALVGLFLGGCIFSFFNERCENIYTSWLIHMFANFAINTVGFIELGIM